MTICTNFHDILVKFSEIILTSLLCTQREKKNLQELSSLGHFLKGSSATLGLIKIKDACEAIQNLGLGMDEAGKTRLNNDAKSLQRIKAELTQVRDEYEKVKKFFEEFYGEEA